MSERRFEKKCRWCDRIFTHWKIAGTHEVKCPIRAAQSETFEKSTRWQRKGWHGPELTEAEAFKGFTDKD